MVILGEKVENNENSKIFFDVGHLCIYIYIYGSKIIRCYILVVGKKV